jgi:hypothetical protein
LNCDPTVQNYKRIEYCTGSEGDDHFIVVDLHQDGVRMVHVIA